MSLGKRPVTTYSIAAYDPQTGELGIAVQSHYFAVGALVPTAMAGVGAIVTQSFAEPQYGRMSLKLLQNGKTPTEVLAAGLSKDRHAEYRQIGIIDHHGRIAAHTGDRCIHFAGHYIGKCCVCLANMMYRDKVWDAMGECFEASSGDLADRLLQVLKTADTFGGDVRGKQSAALLVVKTRGSQSPQSDRPYDIRVDDHPTPLKELKRLIQLKKAYAQNDRGANHLLEGDFTEAHRAFAKAEKLAPDVIELTFWRAVAMLNAGLVDQSLPLFAKVFAKDKHLALLLDRLPNAGLMSDNPKLLKMISQQADED